MEDPKLGDYYYSETCTPKTQGRICCGDCIECRWKDILAYERHLAKRGLDYESYLAKRKLDTPEREESHGQPIMIRGQMYGPDGLIKPKKLEVKRREPLNDKYPDGYLESDKSFVLNNCELCVRLLEDLQKKEDQGNFYYYYDIKQPVT
jgi:hypothetical protein